MGLKERWVRRQPPPPRNGVQIFEEEEVFEGVTAQEVWDLVRPAEAALLLDPTCVRAWGEPGTDGVGEVQTFVQLVDGQEVRTRIEIVEEKEPEFARVRHLEAAMPAQTLFAIKPVTDGVRFRVVLGCDVPADRTVVDDSPAREWAAEFFRGLRQALDQRNR